MSLILSQIFIYPIKSLGGIALSEAEVQQRGLQYDRRWMLVDADGTFLTQRSLAEMALLKVSLGPEGLVIRHLQRPELGTLSVPFTPPARTMVQVQVWDDTCLALAVSPEADTWFSTALALPCRLVYMPDTTRRQVDLDYGQPGDITSFSDGYPILIAGSASLDDLNGRLVNPIPMDRFRPNLVFSGGAPFEEDRWQEFEIGNVTFKGVKPCGRCVVTTIDQQTAGKSAEPLRTLSTYRQQGNKILFGQNVIPTSAGGTIRLGDQIRVAAYR